MTNCVSQVRKLWKVLAKSDLLTCFQEITDERSDAPPITSLVIDGAAIVQMLKPTACKNFNLHHAWTWYGTPTELTHSKLVKEQNVENEFADV